MVGELDEFVDEELESQDSVQPGVSGYSFDAFLFRYGAQTYAVSAAHVAGVVPWRTPVPLPRGDPRVGGVIQDRGRIVVLMAHPTGEPRTEPDAKPARVLICPTERGYVGIPASATLRVGPVCFAREPQALATVDTDAGVLMYLDPSDYVMR